MFFLNYWHIYTFGNLHNKRDLFFSQNAQKQSTRLAYRLFSLKIMCKVERKQKSDLWERGQRLNLECYTSRSGTTDTINLKGSLNYNAIGTRILADRTADAFGCALRMPKVSRFGYAVPPLSVLAFENG